jgi:hypothetical protein
MLNVIKRINLSALLRQLRANFGFAASMPGAKYELRVSKTRLQLLRYANHAFVVYRLCEIIIVLSPSVISVLGNCLIL